MKRVSVFFVLAIGLMSQTKKPAAPAQGGVQASITRGKQVYFEQCLSCHQADAGGVQGMTPPLIKTKYVLGDKPTLIKVVLNGLSGVEIDGEKFNGVMAPHPELTDVQIADVLTYLRNNFGNKASAVTAAQVKAIRAANHPGVNAGNKPK
jgi:mono/diheme cytochrome c family protein